MFTSTKLKGCEAILKMTRFDHVCDLGGSFQDGASVPLYQALPFVTDPPRRAHCSSRIQAGLVEADLAFFFFFFFSLVVVWYPQLVWRNKNYVCSAAGVPYYSISSGAEFHFCISFLSCL